MDDEREGQEGLRRRRRGVHVGVGGVISIQIRGQAFQCTNAEL